MIRAVKQFKTLAAAMFAVIVCLGCVDNGDNSAEYTLNINLNPINGGFVDCKPNKSSYKAGETIAVTATADAGYRFVRWTGVSTSTNKTINITVNADLELTANFELTATPPATPSTIKFNPSGGTVSPTSAATNADGKLASLPTPTRSGYTFDGWYTATTGGTKVEVSKVYSANTTIYARWTAEPVTPPTTGNTFTDSRDNKTYKKVTIGTQTWMGENLNYNASGSVCYGDDPANCNTYGRLYNWSTAMNGSSSSSLNPSGVRGACPVGWHLPSDAEWTTLTNYVGTTAGTKLKSSQYWNSSSGVPAGSDAFGFSALPGGGGYRGGVFSYVDELGHWWSATADGVSDAWLWRMDYNKDKVNSFSDGKIYQLSVRCVQD